ncbi:MAG TPA: GNAT family N-acetyltransferase [Saprospiraceae bacterium]|nr:GNAT family N-acetyltransferase [Saprospiraceae bacterium]HMQ82128.1 GNAT family N-acetyltransferase [Saprospiraceae bacterium]
MEEPPVSRFPMLMTSRLVLRPIWGIDLAALFALRSDARVNRYLDRPLAQNEGDVKEFMINIRQGQERGEHLYWVITSLEEATLLGAIGLWNFSDDRREAELGFELLPDFQGQGIMAEALQMILHFAFSVVALETVNAFTHPDNAASIRSLEKQGFVSMSEQAAAAEGMLQFRLKKSDLLPV